MKGDTPIKTGQNRQCIDNITDYDREHNRIFKSVRHRLDLGPKMLLGAQQHTTVESAAALKIQDKIEGKYDESMQNINGQYRNEMYKRAENMIPQLDGTFNVSDDNNNNNLFNVYTYNDRPYILIFNFVILYNTHIYVRVTLSQKAVSETDRVPIIVFTILLALHFKLGMVINFHYF